jgi:dUTP pyrophosphatase
MSLSFICRVCGCNEYQEKFLGFEPYSGLRICCCSNCNVVFFDETKFSLPPVKIQYLSEDIVIKKHTAGSVGYDLFSMIDSEIEPFGVVHVPTGVKISLPEGVEAQIRMRSGLASEGLILANGVGTIDSDYRGELVCIIMNASVGMKQIERGQRIAQLLFSLKLPFALVKVDTLDETERSSSGFGSTGKF